MNNTYLLLGGNEGNREECIAQALHIMSGFGTVIKRSSLYETAAWGITEQPAFLNMVVLFQTQLSPQQLLTNILETENKMGRHRTEKWGPRTIDIDILFFNDEIIDLPELIIPHPMIAERRFTLVPLVEIAPSLAHPVLHTTILELLNVCSDKLEVRRYRLNRIT